MLRSNASPSVKKSKYEKLVKMHNENLEKKRKCDLNVEELEGKKKVYEELKAKFQAMNLVS